MNAAQLLAEAEAAGVSLRVEKDSVRLSAAIAPPPELLARLSAVKLELLEILRGDRCRHCGDWLFWRKPNAVVFGDGRAAHVVCYEQAGTVELAVRGKALA